MHDARDKDGEGHPLNEEGKEHILIVRRVEQPGQTEHADEYDGQYDQTKEGVQTLICPDWQVDGGIERPYRRPRGGLHQDGTWSWVGMRLLLRGVVLVRVT